MHCLTDPAWKDVFGGPMVLPANSCVLQQGIVPSNVYALDEGAIMLVHVTENGDERVIDIRRAPALIGVAFALAGRPASVDAITLSPCSLRWCSVPSFLSASASDATRVNDVLRWHCEEIVNLCDRAVFMSLKTSGQRLRHFMAHHAVTDGSGGTAPTLPFKQSLVASFINVTPEHLSRLIKKMAKADGPRLIQARSGGAGKRDGHQRTR